MNKVFTINLGGTPFTIDEDAYEYLKKYLNTIHGHFRSTEGYEDITADIEARMAELFQERLANRPIVNIKDVQAVVGIMGRPEEFGAEPLEDERDTAPFATSFKTGKRLFRHPDDVQVGGVCAGLAAYFGISDPVWVRLLFVLVALSGGFGVPIYFVLWAIVPKASTSSDFLAMRGEPINVASIVKTVQDGIQHFTEKISELEEEFDSKKKIKQGRRPTLKALESPLRKGFL